MKLTGWKMKTVVLLIAAGCVFFTGYAVMGSRGDTESYEYRPAPRAEGRDESSLRQEEQLERLQKSLNTLEGVSSSHVTVDGDSVTVRLTLAGDTESMPPDADELKEHIRSFTKKRDVSIVITEAAE